MKNETVQKKKKWYKRIPASYLKIAAFVFGTSIFLGLSAFTLHQYGMLSDQGSTIYHQRKTINKLTANLTSERDKNDVILAKNNSLQLELHRLTDSIGSLNHQIANYQHIINKQSKVVHLVQSKIKGLMTEYTAVKDELAKLTNQQVAEQNRLQLVKKEKQELQQQIESLNKVKEEELAKEQHARKEVMARKVREARYMRLSNVIKNTKVHFQKISLRNKKSTKPLTKIGKTKNDWRYTLIEFYLENEDMAALLDEQFVVKIVNTDTYEILSLIESNPNFPDSDQDSKGVKFKFDGQLVSLDYYNNQKKQGKNFELQVYYIDDDGKEYLLANGTQQFVIDRNVIGV